MTTTRPDTATWYRAAGHRPNRCNLSALAIADQAFQEHPQPLEILWVRREHGGFFDDLAGISDRAERRAVFHEFAINRFWLYEAPERRPSKAERARRSHVGILRGWGSDSNGSAGAVLKGWAENRFGLRPVYHGGRLSVGDRADRYEAARMRGAMSGIGMLLDLLYTFCQEELRRDHQDQEVIELFRGTHDAECYLVKEADGREELVEFNSVSSFTSDRERAWEFGSAVWRVTVPLSKIVFFSGLLPNGLLSGESEYIVLGGDYRVRRLAW